MNAARKRKMVLIFFMATILSAASALILYALRQNINLFYTPTQLAKGEAATNQVIRLGGMVVKGSVVRASDGLSVTFRLTDFKDEITVTYRGTLPDLFREGQGIVALGRIIDKQHFTAQEVLAKHDANYMPPDLKAALVKAPSL